VGPSIGRNFTGQQCVQKLSLGERGSETHARCRAGEAQKIRPAGLQRLLDEEHQAQLIEEGFDLADAKILDDAIFELIERGTGELRRTRELRLSQAASEPCAPDFMAYLLQFHGVLVCFNVKYI